MSSSSVRRAPISLTVAEANLFDQTVEYEVVGEWLAQNDPTPRGQYRADFVLTSASRRSNSWNRVQDEATDQFWSVAYEVASKQFPQLEMRPLSLTKGSKWITFRPRDLPTQPKHIYISLKADRGFVDLTFGNTKMPTFVAAVNDLLESKMTVHQTGASSAIRIAVPSFQVADGGDASRPKFVAAFTAASQLIEFLQRSSNCSGCRR